MSSTRTPKRAPDSPEFYETPAWCVRRLLDVCPIPRGRLLEPCAGNGAIIRAVNEHPRNARGTWTAIERDPDRARHLDRHRPEGTHEVMEADYFHVSNTFAMFSAAITNPPFNQALRFAEYLTATVPWVALLLRLNWFASEARNLWLRSHTPSVYVLPNRPSFTPDGKTDSIDYCWAVWSSLAPEFAVLPATPLSERQKGTTVQ